MDRDWRGWIDFVKVSADKPTPELLLIQDIEESERDSFQCELQRAFGGIYHGRAVTNTDNLRRTQRAVIWRDSRFNLIDPFSRTHQGFGGQTDQCFEGADNGGMIQVKLRDNAQPAGVTRTITAASFKTAPGTRDVCPWRNTKLINNMLTASAWQSNLMVFGTDANNTDRTPPAATSGYSWTCWYRGTVHNLGNGCATPDANEHNRGFTDPIHQKCQTSPLGEGSCLANEWTKTNADTMERKRIDFVFVKRGDGLRPAVTSDQQTMRMGNPQVCDTDRPGTWGSCHSDHRAIRAYIHY